MFVTGDGCLLVALKTVSCIEHARPVPHKMHRQNPRVSRHVEIAEMVAIPLEATLSLVSVLPLPLGARAWTALPLSGRP